MDYAAAIKESLNELENLERSTKELKARDRIRFLRYFKSGQARSQKEAGALIGIEVRQSQRIWHRYRTKGLQDLLKPAGPKNTGKLTEQQEAELIRRLKDDDIVTLEQARKWIEEHFGVRYGISGVWTLFDRLEVKLKTGRPSNIRQDAEEVEAFKKTSQP